MLRTDLYLKDKTITDLVQEKSQLLEKISELEAEKKENGRYQACNIIFIIFK